MINLIKICRMVSLAMLLSILPSSACADQITKEKVTVVYEKLADGTYKVIDVYNNASSRISLYVDNYEVTVNSGGSVKVNRIAKKKVYFNYPKSSGPVLLRYTPPVAAPVVEEAPQQEVENDEKETIESSPVSKPKKERPTANPRLAARGESPLAAIERLNQDAFFGTEAVSAYIQKADAFTKAFSRSGNKAQFLIDNDIEKFLNESEAELSQRKSEIPTIAQEVVVATKITDATSQVTILQTVIQTLNTRLNQRETAYNKLKDAVAAIPAEVEKKHPFTETVVNYSIIGVIVLVLLIWTILAIRKKKNKAEVKRRSVPVQQHGSDSGDPAIVVRRRTTSILKKQSLDDVIRNPEYMLINSSDFTPDSAVRNIYIKNTCIKDVYHLYAEDLRNSSNPKEDGCMVLGRWVFNEESHTYDISLETVVFPGDDAVFKEYELNFGGKIKLRIAEKLRKLRRETNLQYDLVCWIHSHPGLGVFFSNSDDNVQTQLKHSQHPNFLIAFVVDILTSTQEMGIFTFRKDGSMNSKGDLTRMYSLEDMYKWALESDKVSFNPENYYNILGAARMQVPSCKGIELNNSSIIDLTQIVVEPATGLVGWVIGTSFDIDGNKEFVVSSVVKAEEKPTAGIIGILLHVTHMSLPTIQRLTASESANLSFVLVYSSRQNIVTSIPVVNGELLTDEHFYGEETIDDLKIWTRRKR